VYTHTCIYVGASTAAVHVAADFEVRALEEELAVKGVLTSRVCVCVCVCLCLYVYVYKYLYLYLYMFVFCLFCLC